METQHQVILLVDDDEDDTFMLGQALKAFGPGYQVQQVFDGSEALKRLREMKLEGTLPCLVVMDINMPRMDGKQTLVAIQGDEELRMVPIVILSTSSSAVDKMFFEQKHVEMITKPFELKTFHDVAKKLLEYCDYRS